MNPRRYWTFKAADLVGKMSKLAHSCTFGLAKHKLSFKILSKYRIMMHLAMARGYTGIEESSE